jgi:chemotaxis protein MotB
MARRKFENNEDEELWLVSYADMMTLVCCFFIIMMAFANYDPVGFQKKVETIAKHFNKDKFKDSQIEDTEESTEISKKIQGEDKKLNTMKDGDLTIVFQGSVLFDNQSADLSPEVLTQLDTMVSTIRSMDPNYRILIEGHTDNIQPDPTSPFINNWALSGTRAANVIARFEEGGFDPSKLVTVSYADTRPLEPLQDEEGKDLPDNQKLNRRVVVKVIKPNEPTKQLKLGLGHYFKDSVENVKEDP